MRTVEDSGCERVRAGKTMRPEYSRRGRLGRYLQPEPGLLYPDYVTTYSSKGLSIPTYAYAHNNPIANTDPTGLGKPIDDRGCNGGKRGEKKPTGDEDCKTPSKCAPKTITVDKANENISMTGRRAIKNCEKAGISSVYAVYYSAGPTSPWEIDCYACFPDLACR